MQNAEDMRSYFDVYQWFEIWTGLTAEQEVNKMLVLNAGHKAVKTKHQLELLFRSLIPIVQSVDLESFDLVREKNMPSISYSKNRVVGQFHFSHIITSLLSFSEGKPLTSNVELVQKTQSDDFDIDKLDGYFSYEFLHEFIRVLIEIDKKLESVYKDRGVKWIGRETSLVGMFAALGKHANENSIEPTKALKFLEKMIIGSPKCLNLIEFEGLRNSLDLAKINIGSVNKKAVYNGVLSILNGGSNSISWEDYFPGHKS